MLYVAFDQQGFAEAIARLRGLKVNLDDTTPLMKQVSVLMQKSVLENFEEGGRPPWPPLSPLTIALRRKGPGGQSDVPRPLRNTGALMNSIDSTFEVDTANVFTNLSYAPDMHYGGQSSPADIAIPQHRRTITQAFGKPIEPREITVGPYTMHLKGYPVPARPFMILQNEDLENIMILANEFIDKQLEKNG